ncbi:helix-turn-helix domain-containing protein [Castellaniella ginsengisoli]
MRQKKICTKAGRTSQRGFDSKSTATAVQHTRILRLLLKRPRNTEELQRAGIFRVSARIRELRRRGFNIVTSRIQLTDRDGFIHYGVALYSLEGRK